MAFQKDFDELLNSILTDYANQFPGVDLSQGSMVFVKSACLASALWGLYQNQEYISRQIFPDTGDSDTLEHHAWLRGLARKTSETDADLLARLLDIIRRPPAGGNKYDYVKWALEVQNVKSAYCIPLAQGLGTVDVVIIADIATGSEIPTQALLDSVRAHIVDISPLNVNTLRVLAPTIVTQDVTMTVTGTNANKTQALADITAYMEALVPGQALYLAQLTAIAVQNGAAGVTVTVPAADVTVTATQMLRPGVVSVE